MSQELSTSITYYVSRLIYEYQRPKAQNTIAILVKQMLMDGLPWSLNEAFNLSTAAGKQLDILGKYIGLPRTIGDPAPLPFFGFVRYSGVGNNPNGLTKYADNDNRNAVFYRYGYNGQNATALSDTSYAFMLLFKIALNHSDSTLYGIQRSLEDTFKGSVRVVDNQDMSLTYYIGTNLPVSPTTLSPYLPKPMGVRLNPIIGNLNIVTGSGDRIITESGDRIVAGNT